MSPSTQRRMSAFKQVDVFTAQPLCGNALAVIFDADGLDAAEMQRLAAWTNLSETAFVLAPTQPGASYRVRIFTPRSELPFAGHPSVGTAHALIEAGRIDPGAALLQECAAGLLPVRVTDCGAERRVFVRAPRARAVPSEPAAIDAFVRALGARPSTERAPQALDNGPNWLICDLGSEDAVRALRPDMAALEAASAKTGIIGISVFGRASGRDYQLAVRAFAPADGVPEDPATGSANAAIGAYLFETGGLDAIGPTYRASQGREIGRDAFIDVCVDVDSGEVEIGGQSVTCIDGNVVL
jgi:PhzF family phenazine biosynthesis protein